MSVRSGAMALLAGLVLTAAGPAAGQSTLDRGSNLDGTWVSEAGVAHFHVLHRFWVTSPPTRKVINTPTLVVAAGLGGGLLAGFRYGSNSALVPGEFNEWELYTRWRPITEAGTGLADVSVAAGYNNVATSVDGELSLSRSVGPVTLLATGRAYSSFRGGDFETAFGAGAVWRIHRNIALAGDVLTLTSVDTTAAWSVGLQLRIPTTPHTLSLHATNAALTTLQSSSFGFGQTLYGFEFTIPLTFNRYFGGSGPGTPESATAPREQAVSDTVVVRMDNRLQFLPDTIRISAGTAVRWENSSDIMHTVTADPAMATLESSVVLPEGAEPFHSGRLRPGDVFVRVFDTPGTYTYFCVPHERAGMVGVVIVEPAGR